MVDDVMISAVRITLGYSVIFTIFYYFVNLPKYGTATSDIINRGGITCEANRTCLDDVGVVGEWVRVGRNRTFAAPFCCGRPTTIWKCSDFFDEYTWQSPNIPAVFNPVDTCRLLGNSTVLLIGDSTMDQFTLTLENSLWPGKCQTQVTFGLSDTLVGRSYGRMNRGKVWKELVEEIKPDIVIVTVGAHILSDDASYTEIVDQVLNEMQVMQQENPDLKFAWKTQSPGGCTKDIVSPTDTSMAAKKLNFTDNSYGKDHYNWYQFYNRDLMLLSRLQMVGIPSLDMRMLYSQSDAHISSQSGRHIMRGVIDCLHICLPGPLDVVGQLFHQLLLDFHDNQNRS